MMIKSLATGLAMVAVAEGTLLNFNLFRRATIPEGFFGTSSDTSSDPGKSALASFYSANPTPSAPVTTTTHITPSTLQPSPTLIIITKIATGTPLSTSAITTTTSEQTPIVQIETITIQGASSVLFSTVTSYPSPIVEVSTVISYPSPVTGVSTIVSYPEPITILSTVTSFPEPVVSVLTVTTYIPAPEDTATSSSCISSTIGATTLAISCSPSVSVSTLTLYNPPGVIVPGGEVASTATSYIVPETTTPEMPTLISTFTSYYAPEAPAATPVISTITSYYAPEEPAATPAASTSSSNEAPEGPVVVPVPPVISTFTSYASESTAQEVAPLISIFTSYAPESVAPVTSTVTSYESPQPTTSATDLGTSTVTSYVLPSSSIATSFTSLVSTLSSPSIVIVAQPIVVVNFTQFYLDFISSKSSYISAYTTFFQTHSFSNVGTQTPILSSLLTYTDNRVTSYLSRDVAASDVLSNIATQFPWYTQWYQAYAATATASTTVTETAAVTSTTIANSAGSMEKGKMRTLTLQIGGIVAALIYLFTF